MLEIQKTRKCFALLGAFLTIVLCAQAGAAPLPPGGIVPTAPEPDPIGGAVIDGGIIPFTSLPGPVTYSGLLKVQVISGGVNPLGGLTFTFQLHNDATSISSIGRLTTLDFSGFLTDVSAQAPLAGLSPTSIDRSFGAGASVGFNFSALGLGLLPPGVDSAVMVVQTNAQFYSAGVANIIDGSIATVPSFGPAVPEPTSMALVLIGCAGLLRRRAQV